ncbi:MAG: metallophosphoesterase [Clostridia bacterium]|nr:metallophosphoesterase [Clostridia bacterium]
MIKRVLCLLASLVFLITLVLPSVSVSASPDNYEDYITDIEETVIEIDGLTQKYDFLHITDSHAVVVSSNPSSSYYAHSVSRYNQFMSQEPTTNGYPAADTLQAMYAYAEDPANGIDCVWLTGDNIDFPTNTNTSFITNLVNNSTVDHLYCFGNHDWTFPDDYFTANGRSTYRPRLTSAMGGNNLYGYRDYGAFVVVIIDNSENYIYYSAISDFIRNTIVPMNKPTILLCHVPFYNSELAAYAKRTWGTDETMSSPSNTKYPYNAATKYIYEWATTNSNVKAIFCGHFHYNYQGYTGRTPIYITASGYSGSMRRIIVKPTSCAVHTWDAGEILTPATARAGRLHHTCTVCFSEEEIDIAPICAFGDPDGDGYVTSSDSHMMRQIIGRAVSADTDAVFYASDVNEDGKINAKDSLLIRKVIAGVIPSFDVN